MRILFIIDDFHVPDVYAGTAVNTHYLVQHLAARGHFVAVVARRLIAEEIFHDRRFGYPLFVGADVIRVTSLVQETYRFDVAINQNRGLWPVIDPLGLDDGPMRVFYEHTVLSRARMPSPEIRGRALCLSNSTLLARRYAVRYGIGSVVVPPIYGIDRFGDIVPQPRHVTMIAIQRSKGTDIALHLARQRPDIHFTIVESWNDGTAESEQLRRDLTGLANVRVLANQPDLADVFAGTGLLLMPSRVSETWGRVVTECQVLGIPVLGSDRGSLPTTIGPGGLTLDPDGELAPWTEALAQLWDDGTARSTYGIAAREHARTFLASLDDTTRRLEFLLTAAAPSAWPQRGEIVAAAAVEEDELPPPLMPARGAKKSGKPGSPPMASRPALIDDRQLPQPGTLHALAVRVSHTIGLDLEPDSRMLVGEAASLELEAARQTRAIAAGAPWQPAFAFVGRHRIETALAGGKGAILLESPMIFSRNVLGTALRTARYPMVRAVATADTELPPGPVGADLQTDVGDHRHEDSIPVDWRRPPLEQQHALRHLRENELLIASPITDIAGDVIELPFSTARLRINLGPFRLALQSGAVLLPVSCCDLPAGSGFEIRVAEPIVADATAKEEDRLRELVSLFAAHVAQDLIRYPAQWLAWDLLVPESRLEDSPRA